MSAVCDSTARSQAADSLIGGPRLSCASPPPIGAVPSHWSKLVEVDLCDTIGQLRSVHFGVDMNFTLRCPFINTKG